MIVQMEDYEIECAPKEYAALHTWNDAELYCRFLSADGKHDWRMPTVEELFAIKKQDTNYWYACSGQICWSSEVDGDSVVKYAFTVMWSQDSVYDGALNVSIHNGLVCVHPVRTVNSEV
jgi:hypothetical protein